MTSTSPTPAPVIPVAPFAVPATQAVAPAPSVLSLLRPRSQLLPHPRACTPSHAIQSPPPQTHPNPSPPPPPAAASVVSSPAVSVVAVHAPSAVASVMPVSSAILVSTTVVSTTTAASSIPSHMASPSPASVVSSPVLTPPTMPAASPAPSAPGPLSHSPIARRRHCPTSPVAAPPLVLSAAAASAQSVALLVSSSISVVVTPSAKVSVTHNTSNDALLSPHATSIAQEDQRPRTQAQQRRPAERSTAAITTSPQEKPSMQAPRRTTPPLPSHSRPHLNDYGKRSQGEPRRPPPLVSSPVCALSSTRPTATCYGEDLDATAGRRQRDSHTSRARRLPPQQQQQQQKQRQRQQLQRHQQHHVVTTHLTRRKHATPPPVSPHRARIPGDNDTSTTARNDTDDTFDTRHTPQAFPAPSCLAATPTPFAMTRPRARKAEDSLKTL
ncbi:hypothetical protein F5148DRAFT_1286564 [Russula earlei]|uniref:Uncharacterized protein n=1 Tax=Russula earlei TaxID=71964 RepID=A0ACC0U488_9AGAM|nr:hypothetical protein F5148DRAFT_1286564 [Russula earlei]